MMMIPALLYYVVTAFMVFVPVYGAYYLLGRKTCRPSRMLQAAGVVVAVALLCALLVEYIDAVPRSAVTPITMVVSQIYAKMHLGFRTGRSWAAAGLYVLFQLVLSIPLLVMLLGGL